MPSGAQFKHILGSGYNSPLIFPPPFLHLQVHLKWTSPQSHKASLFLHSSVLISFGRKTRCGWQIITEKGFGNCPFCSVTVLLTDGHSEYWKCSGPPYTPSACEWWALPAFFLLSISKFKKNHLDLYLFFQPNTKSHLWRGSLPPLLLPPHYIFFWNRENSQDVSTGWHEWVPTVLTDLLKDLFFAWELHIWPRMIILGSVLVEIIGRSHLKKSDWLACLFNFNPLSPSQSN